MEELRASLALCEEKYGRLFRAHDKLQRLNQCLEEKLLNQAETHHAESSQFSSQIDELTQGLVEARVYIHQLEDENDRYRNDINAVVQLLQCKPSSFVSPKIGMLPEDLQRKVLGQKNGVCGRKEKKIIKVQVPSSLPQMDIMYAVDKGRVTKRSEENDIVSAAIMARILEERERERSESQMSSRCHCALGNIRLPTRSVHTQTLPSCTISYSGFACPEYSVIPPPNNQNTNQNIKEPEDIDIGQRKPEQISPLNDRPSPISPPKTNFQILSNLTSPRSECGSVSVSVGRIHRPNSLKLSQSCQPKKSIRVEESQGHGNEDTHWSTTVLVQHPPKRLVDPLFHSNSKHGEVKVSTSSSMTTTPLTPTTPHEMESDETQHLLSQSTTCPSANANASAKYNSHSQSRQQQYYRAQKRSFWTRSSSTTSTETEI